MGWLGLLMALPACAPAADAEGVTAAASLEPVRAQFARDGHFDGESLATLQRLRADHPRDRSVMVLLEQALLEREDWNALVALVGERTETAPAAAQAADLATVLLKAQRYDEAAECLASAGARESEDVKLVWLTAFADFHRGRHAEAAALIDERLDDLLSGGIGDALLLRGTIALQADEFEQARELLERFVVLQPTHPAAHDALGRTLAALGDDQAAGEHLERAQALHAALSRAETTQARLSARASAANAAFAEGDYATCERLLKEMIPTADTDLQVELYRYLARVHTSQGRTAEADQALERARQLGVEPR
jgi:tetratricopeptide (TPR) repeat protein